ncbi:MAG: hypothetical protein KIT09_12330 [Bryobacteraceae bacterium]|nr:hypothetical protein [Bryobacteraceae bacterium]
MPPSYETSGKRYPVIYYFHGHSDRYTLERYDDGRDTIPKMAAFVASHDVVVVAVDGYVAEHYTGFYGGSPWDIRADGGDYDFGLVFQELVAHVDATYRTLTGRRHRALSGLSMGGFMSLYLSARYPGLIGSASSFNPGPEFYVGDKGARSLWRAKDHVSNHNHTMVRLIRASGDYISQYHEETRDAYARAHAVDFEYRRDEYHRHWATSITETFDFHMRAFAKPALDNVPEFFSHADAYRNFEAWGYRVDVRRSSPAIVYLEDVSQGGMRISTRRWAPDGLSLPDASITVTTPPLYRPGARYAMTEHDLASGRTSRRDLAASDDGRLTVTVDGAGRQLSFAGPGTGAEPPVLLPLTSSDRLRLRPNLEQALPVKIYNPRGTPMEEVAASIESEYPTVEIVSGSAKIPRIEPGAFADLASRLKVRFTAGAGHFAPARLKLTLTFDGWHQVSRDIDVLVIPEIVAAPAALEILDGRTVTLPVFRQKGNQGGGGSIRRTLTEGKGNGNGVLEPGEEATIWIKMPQGMDPFDKNNWYRAKVYPETPLITEIGDIQEQKQLEWTSAQERTSLIRLAPDAPAGAKLPLLLDNESWSYHWTPDVRYGPELLYQAFQLHSRHLHQLTLEVPPAR